MQDGEGISKGNPRQDNNAHGHQRRQDEPTTRAGTSGGEQDGDSHRSVYGADVASPSSAVARRRHTSPMSDGGGGDECLSIGVDDVIVGGSPVAGVEAVTLRMANMRTSPEDVLYPDARRPGPPKPSQGGGGQRAYHAHQHVGAVSSRKFDTAVGPRRSPTNKHAAVVSWRLASSLVTGAGADGSGRKMKTLVSSEFVLSAAGADGDTVKWRLLLKPFEFTPDTMSVYLQCASVGGDGGRLVDAKFSFGIACATSGDAEDDDEAVGQINNTIIVQHTFSGDEASWGVQEFANMDDVLRVASGEGWSASPAPRRRTRSRYTPAVDAEMEVKLVMIDCKIVSSGSDIQSPRLHQHGERTARGKDGMQQSGSGWARKYPIKLPSESSIHSSGSSGSLKSDAEEEACESSSFEVQTTSTYYSKASRSERLADVGIAPVLISESPRIIVVDNFLTNNECDNIMRLARPDLRRSRVASGLEIEGRTSSGTFLTGRKEKDRTVVTIEKKIADFMNNTSVRELYDWHNHPLMRGTISFHPIPGGGGGVVYLERTRTSACDPKNVLFIRSLHPRVFVKTDRRPVCACASKSSPLPPLQPKPCKS